MDEEILLRFIAVANCGSFSEAGRMLSYSSQTISASIRSLEEELDVKLFNREGNSLVLTFHGEHFLAKAQTIVTMIASARKSTTSLLRACGENSPFRLGMSTNMLYRAHSNIMFLNWVVHQKNQSLFRTILCPAGDGLVALSNKLLDMLVFGTFEIKQYKKFFDEVTFEKFGEVPLIVALSKANALAQKRELSLKELCEKPLVLYTNSTVQELYLQNKCADQGVVLSYIDAPGQEKENSWDAVERDEAYMLVHLSPHWVSAHPNCTFLPLSQDCALVLDLYLAYHKDSLYGQQAIYADLKKLFVQIAQIG